MGAVLAMSAGGRFASLARLGAAALLTAGLVACSSGEDQGSSALGEAFKAAKGVVATKIGGGQAARPGAQAPAASPPAVADRSKPLMQANLESFGITATLRLARENAGFRTWASPDKVTVTTRGGVITATRGLPGDLLAADAGPLLAALAGGPARYRRSLRLLGGDREILRSQLDCELTALGAETVAVQQVRHATRRYAETCRDGAGNSLRNDFWRGASGTLWKSRQFLHPKMGYVTLQTLAE